ncbi:uncharacterized protein WM277_009320 [Molossus nigricans]
MVIGHAYMHWLHQSAFPPAVYWSFLSSQPRQNLQCDDLLMAAILTGDASVTTLLHIMSKILFHTFISRILMDSRVTMFFIFPSLTPSSPCPPSPAWLAMVIGHAYMHWLHQSAFPPAVYWSSLSSQPRQDLQCDDLLMAAILTVAAPVCIPTSSVLEFPYSTPSPNLQFDNLLMAAILTDVFHFSPIDTFLSLPPSPAWLAMLIGHAYMHLCGLLSVVLTCEDLLHQELHKLKQRLLECECLS